MKLHKFTSKYSINLCQLDSDGWYYANVINDDTGRLFHATGTYELWEEAVENAVFIIKEKCTKEMEAITDEKDN